jgi:hypothetical protein
MEEGGTLESAKKRRRWVILAKTKTLNFYKIIDFFSRFL